MKMTEIRSGSDVLRTLEQINEEAFPENERCPLQGMLDTGAAVLCVEEDGDPAGFLAVRHFRNLVYLAYFAVRRDLRSRGLGSRALRELIRLYPDRQVIVEYEAPETGCANNAEWIRRKQFYLRNGFYETGWHTHYDGTEFEIGCSRPDFDSGAFIAFAEEIAKTVSDHIPNPFPKRP